MQRLASLLGKQPEGKQPTRISHSVSNPIKMPSSTGSTDSGILEVQSASASSSTHDALTFLNASSPHLSSAKIRHDDDDHDDDFCSIDNDGTDTTTSTLASATASIVMSTSAILSASASAVLSASGLLQPPSVTKELVDDDFIELNPDARLPLKHRPLSHYPIGESADSTQQIKTGIHTIFKRQKATKSTAPNAQDIEPNHYLKSFNADNDIFTLLEPFYAGCYEILNDNLVPASVRTVYDPINNVNYVCSSEISDFVPAKSDPLTQKIIDFKLPPHISIKEMEEFSQRHREEQIRQGKNYVTRAPSDVIAPLKGTPITLEDLTAYEVKRDSGYLLTGSHLNEEDDLHGNNMGKRKNNGNKVNKVRIDFDGSNSSLAPFFKVTSTFAAVFRTPVDYVFTVKDFEQFPDLTFQQTANIFLPPAPFYHPSKPEPYIGLRLFSRNPWTADENAMYVQLSKDEIFKHAQHEITLKYLLLDADLYRPIAAQHIPLDKKHPTLPENQTVIEFLIAHIAKRKVEIRDLMLQIPAFIKFIVDHGDDMIEKICGEIAERNQKYLNKIEKTTARRLDKLISWDTAQYRIKTYESLIIDVQKIRDNFSLMKKNPNITRAEYARSLGSIQSMMAASAAAGNEKPVTSTERTARPGSQINHPVTRTTSQPSAGHAARSGSNITPSTMRP